MFTIKSYIKYPKKKIYDLADVEARPLHYFIDIDNTAEILPLQNKLNRFYIEGAIYLTYNKKIIMNFTHYDLIDQLWEYLLNLIEEFLENKKAEMYFPDQPLPISMEHISDQYLLFSINFVPYKLPRHEFLLVLLLGAKNFFEKMISSLGEPYQLQLKKTKKIEQKINTLKR
jgi:hypothetical protein